MRKIIRKIIMRKVIVLLAVLVLLPQVFAQSLSSQSLSYSVIMEYNEGVFSLKDILLIKASPPPASKTGEYTARIISFKGDVLFETTFNVNIEPFYSMPLSKETAKPSQQLTKTTFDLLIPYFANGKSLHILRDNELLFETDVSKFSTCNENNICEGFESTQTCASDCTCGNNVCEPQENYMRCSTDCKSGQKDTVCDHVPEGICDPDCTITEDNDCKQNSNLLLYGVTFALLVLVIFGIMYRHRRKKSHR